MFVNATGDQALGLAIRWLNPETSLAPQLWRDHGITDDQPRKTGRYLKNPTLMAAIPRLYAEMEVLAWRGIPQGEIPGVSCAVHLPRGCQFQKMSTTALYELSLPPGIWTDLQKPRQSTKIPVTTRVEEKSKKSPSPETKVLSEQKGYEGPVYSPDIMAGILRGYQIASAPDVKSSRDSRGQFVLTAYPLQSLTETVFLQDLLQDWQERQGRLENRRVAYLFNAAQAQGGHAQCLGLVIQYTAPATEVASQVWQKKHTELKTADPTTLLTSSVLTEAAPQFYRQVEITILGVAAHPALVEQLKGPLAKVCRGRTALNFKAIPLPPRAYSVVLVEDLLGLLQHGQTREVDPAVAAAAHRERCLQAILSRWTETEHRHSPLHQALLAALRTVLIMATLQTQRRSGYRQPGEDDLSPRMQKDRDDAMKRYLYAQRFPDPRALIEGLPLTVLASFLLTSDATAWLQTLNQHKDTIRQQNLLWEMDLKEKARHQRPTPCDRLTEVLAFIYHSSFIGLGGEVFRLTARTAMQEGKSEHKENKNNKESKENKYAPKPLDLADFEAKTLGGLVRRLTRSDTLASTQ